MPVRIEVRADSDQSQKMYRYILCPSCQQKLADLEYMKGVAIIRFKCRRCGKYIMADLVGVE